MHPLEIPLMRPCMSAIIYAVGFNIKSFLKNPANCSPSGYWIIFLTCKNVRNMYPFLCLPNIIISWANTEFFISFSIYIERHWSWTLPINDGMICDTLTLISSLLLYPNSCDAVWLIFIIYPNFSVSVEMIMIGYSRHSKRSMSFISSISLDWRLIFFFWIWVILRYSLYRVLL